MTRIKMEALYRAGNVCFWAWKHLDNLIYWCERARDKVGLWGDDYHNRMWLLDLDEQAERHYEAEYKRNSEWSCGDRLDIPDADVPSDNPAGYIDLRQKPFDPTWDGMFPAEVNYCDYPECECSSGTMERCKLPLKPQPYSGSKTAVIDK
jgi:hypothetical protein